MKKIKVHIREKRKKIKNKSTMEKRATPVKNTKKKNNKEEKTRKKKKRKEAGGCEGRPDSREGIGEKVCGGSKIDSQRKWDNVSRACCGSDGGPGKRGRYGVVDGIVDGNQWRHMREKLTLAKERENVDEIVGRRREEENEGIRGGTDAVNNITGIIWWLYSVRLETEMIFELGFLGFVMEEEMRKGKKEGEGGVCSWAEEDIAGIFWVLIGTGGAGAAPVLEGDKCQLSKGKGNIGFLGVKEREWAIRDLGFLMRKEGLLGFLMRMGSCWASSWAADGFAKFTLRAFFKSISKYLHSIFNLDTFNPQFRTSFFVKPKFTFQIEYSYFSSKPVHHKIFSLAHFQTEFFLMTVEGQANFYPP